MKKAITLDDIRNDTKIQDDARTLYKNLKSIKDFGFYCTERVFVYLFGLVEGRRLWLCFVVDTERDIYKLFFEYLSNEQQFVFAANLQDTDNLRTAAAIYKYEY
ncbi:MAG: hypothetical protein ACRCZZ_06820 [Phocaeicola sp.]